MKSRQAMNRIRFWLRSPIAILGAGISGQAADRLIRSLGGTSVVYDEFHADFPDFTEEDAARHELVIVSPGFRQDHPWMKMGRLHSCEIIGELDLASLLWKGKVVAVTGTNGKSTLVEFIAHSLRYAGFDARAVGNIGIPFAQSLTWWNSAEAWAVVEVSSFQAETMRYFRADSALWSNFSEDHLDRHGSMRSYFEAKANLLSVGRPRLTLLGKNVAPCFSRFGRALPPEAQVLSGPILRGPEGSIFNLRPQWENFQLAAALFRSWGFDPKILLDSVTTFEQSPHRLRRVSRINGVEFWNDSKATNFSAAEAALKHFNRKVFWLGGGKPKGGRIESFARRISPSVGKAFLTGDTADQLGQVFDELRVSWQRFDSLENSVRAAFDQAGTDDVVVFSPGFASQKPFKNFSERGRCFERVLSDLEFNLQITH